MARSSCNGCMEFIIPVVVILFFIFGMKFAFTRYIEWQTSPEMMEMRRSYDPEWQKAEAQRELARQMAIQNELKMRELQMQGK